MALWFSRTTPAFQIRLILAALMAVLAMQWVRPPNASPVNEPRRPLSLENQVFAESPRATITPECQKSIDRGTEWLVSAISLNGVGADVGQRPDLSCTAITGLALLSQGNTFSGGRHSRELRSILNVMLQKIDDLDYDERRGLAPSLVQRKIGRNADLFLSALFLSQAFGDSSYNNKDIHKSLDKLVGIIAGTQGKDGTWGNDSWAPVLGTVLGWESLRAASSCGIKVDASATLAGKALLNKLKEKSADEADWMHHFYKEASSIRVLHSMGYRDEPDFEKCVQRILKLAREDHRHFAQAGGEEYLAFSLVTECLLQRPRDSWQPWYPTVCDKLIRIQNRDGSWSGHHCITDRTFCTAAVLLTLQAPLRCMPISDL